MLTNTTERITSTPITFVTNEDIPEIEPYDEEELDDLFDRLEQGDDDEQALSLQG